MGIRTHLAGSNSIVRSELWPCISKYSILRPPLAHGRNGGQTQDRIGLGLMTSACLWFHGKLSGGNRRGKELLSLCTQGKKNPVGPHVRRGWRVVACVRGKSKE